MGWFKMSYETAEGRNSYHLNVLETTEPTLTARFSERRYHGIKYRKIQRQESKGKCISFDSNGKCIPFDPNAVPRSDAWFAYRTPEKGILGKDKYGKELKEKEVSVNSLPFKSPNLTLVHFRDSRRRLI